MCLTAFEPSSGGQELQDGLDDPEMGFSWEGKPASARSKRVAEGERSTRIQPDPVRSTEEGSKCLVHRLHQVPSIPRGTGQSVSV